MYIFVLYTYQFDRHVLGRRYFEGSVSDGQHYEEFEWKRFDPKLVYSTIIIPSYNQVYPLSSWQNMPM